MYKIARKENFVNRGFEMQYDFLSIKNKAHDYALYRALWVVISVYIYIPLIYSISAPAVLDSKGSGSVGSTIFSK